MVTPHLEVLEGIRIFNSKFIDEIKNKGTNKELRKSRLIIQAYNN
jgi:hypothetical protein